MKTAYLAVGVLAVGLSLFTSAGCQSNSPSKNAGSGSTPPAAASKDGHILKNVAGTYEALVDADPVKVTRATRKAAEKMGLTEIASSHTDVDGKVTARAADDSAVIIDIQQAGDDVSKVSIRVGDKGDEAVSKQIFDGIKDNLGWF